LELESRHIAKLKMLELVEILKHHSIIKTNQDFCNQLGISKQLFNAIKNQGQYFTFLNIYNAVIAYNVNANWIFGLEKNIFRVQTKPQTNITKRDLKLTLAK
jgi:hypothetical protein